MSDYAMEHKLPRFNIVELTNKDPRFYGFVGPLLSQREVVAELGGPVWDDADKQWMVAVSEEGDVLGTVAVRRGVVVSLYVVPGHRGELVGTTMLLRLLLRTSGTKLRAHATPAAVGLFERVGFTRVRERGKFAVMERAT